MLSLQQLLQPRLRIFGELSRVEAVQLRIVHAKHRLLRGVESCVEQDRTEQRFQRISEDRRPARAAAFQLSLTQSNRFSEIERKCQPMQRLLVDEIRAHPGQVSLRDLREATVSADADGAIEHAVADEFETLVVFRAEAAVGQSLAEQLRLPEIVTERREPVAGHRDKRVYLVAVASNSSSKLTLPTRGSVLVQLALTVI